ncbi:MAG: lysophospholipid acyltransferase family protein [Candidatus Eisenbacteria bacterium]
MPTTIPHSHPAPPPTLSVLILEFAFRVTALMPVTALEAVASLLAAFDGAFSTSRRDGLRHNLAAIAAWGHPLLSSESMRRSAERAVFRSYYRACLEYLSHRRGGRGAHAPRFTGAERLYRALATGSGAVVTVPHLGNWELAGLAMARLGFRVHVVAGVQFHASVSRAVHAAKEADRIAVSTPEDGFLPLLRTLRSGGLVVLLADGDVFARGGLFRFFGAPAEFPVGPALLARRAGVAIVHAYAVRECDGRQRIVFESVDRPDRSRPVAEDVTRLTEGMVRALERAIAANVTQWCIFRPLVGASSEPDAAIAPIATHAA